MLCRRINEGELRRKVTCRIEECSKRLISIVTWVILLAAVSVEVLDITYILRLVSGVMAAGDIRISNQFLITRALHFAQLRLRPLNYNP